MERGLFSDLARSIQVPAQAGLSKHYYQFTVRLAVLPEKEAEFLFVHSDKCKRIKNVETNTICKKGNNGYK